MTNGHGESPDGAGAMPASVIEKIRKLLRLAECQGATPEEAALAGERAQALLMRHKLERAAIGDLHAQVQAATAEPVVETRFEGRDTGVGATVPTWWSVLLNGVVKSSGCEALLYRYGRGSASWSFSIIGRAVDVQVARELLTHLTAACLRLTRAYRPQREASYTYQGDGGATIRPRWAIKGRELSTARKAFRLGCASRISQRLREAAAEREAAARAGQATSDESRALVLVTETDRRAVAAYMKEHHSDLRAARRSRMSLGGADHYAAGRRAGDTVGLSAQRKVGGRGPSGYLS